MNFAWLKRYMPRSLYGRAALILIVPIVTIQLVVSVVFIQRLYEDVTEQMTRFVVAELSFLLEEVEASETVDEARNRMAPLLRPLDLQVTIPSQGRIADQRQFYDLSGRVVGDTIRQGIAGTLGIDLKTNSRIVQMEIATKHGNMAVTFQRRRVSARNPHQLLVLMLVTSVLMTIIAYIFLRNQMRPIKRLSYAAEAFGKGQHIKYQPSGATEVRAAGAAFLDMRARLERQIEQRTLMLSGVSHDLRTPLTRLKLGLSMLEEDEETKALLRDVDDMQRLLDTFLSFARNDAEDLPEQVDPVALVKTLVENARRSGKNVTLSQVDGNESAAKLLIRPVPVQRALENLIGNGTHYAHRCEVSVVVSDRAVRFSVEDDGPGIATDDREEAVKPFARLEPGRNQNRAPGVGLGLSIAMDVARSHGGTLQLGRSEKLGGLRADLVLARMSQDAPSGS